MKKLLRITMLLAIVCQIDDSAAQNFTPPKNLPLKPVGTTPTKFHVVMPDMQVVSAGFVSIETMPDPNLIRIKISVTYKNAGAAATGRTFDLGLIGFHAVSAGGATSISSYEIAIEHDRVPLASNQSRTEEWSFVKDKTKLSKGNNQCMIVADYSERITESDETNNKSGLFLINVP